MRGTISVDMKAYSRNAVDDRKDGVTLLHAALSPKSSSALSAHVKQELALWREPVEKSQISLQILSDGTSSYVLPKTPEDSMMWHRKQHFTS